MMASLNSVSNVHASDSEIFRVLKRANLLCYFDAFIQLGGDDARQLYDSDDAEFLEITKLVGMAAKPLHVRRFKKALVEWNAQPSLFSDQTASQTLYSGVECLESGGQSGSSPPAASSSTTSRDSSAVAKSLDVFLTENEIKKIFEAALDIVETLPDLLHKPVLSNKMDFSIYETIVLLRVGNPQRMEKVRTLIAPYAKSFKLNRVVDRLATKEAIAQLCNLAPALFTRKGELFKLVQQVIRDTGLPFAVIGANSNLPVPSMTIVNDSNNDEADKTNTKVSSNNSNTVSIASKAKAVKVPISSANDERITEQFRAAWKRVKLNHNVTSIRKMRVTVFHDECDVE